MTKIYEHVNHLVNQALVEELADPSLESKIAAYQLSTQDEKITRLQTEIMERIKEKILQDFTFQTLSREYTQKFPNASIDPIVQDPVSLHTCNIFLKVQNTVQSLFPEQPKSSFFPGFIAGALQILGY